MERQVGRGGDLFSSTGDLLTPSRGAFARRRAAFIAALGLSASREHLGGSSASAQILQASLKLFNDPAQLLGLAAELHALEFIDLRLELLDLQIALSHVLLHLRDRRACLKQHGFECIDIIREIGAVRHRRSLRVCRAVYNIDNAAVRRGCLQSMPSRSIDSCA